MRSSEFLNNYQHWLASNKPRQFADLSRDRVTKNTHYLRAATALLRRAPDRVLALDYVTRAVEEPAIAPSTRNTRGRLLEYIKINNLKTVELENDLEKIFRALDSELVTLYCAQHRITNTRWLRYLITDLQFGVEILDVRQWLFSHGQTQGVKAIYHTVTGFLDWAAKNYSLHPELLKNGVPLDLEKILSGIVAKESSNSEDKQPADADDKQRTELLIGYATDPVSSFALALILVQGLTASRALQVKHGEIKSGLIDERPLDPLVQDYYNKLPTHGFDGHPVITGIKIPQLTIIANRFLAYYKFKGDGVNGLRKI